MSVERYGGLADAAARRYGLPTDLFRRLVTQESGWRADARSPADARGLTQVVPRWHPSADLSTPASQLDYGAKHLATLYRNLGRRWDLALAGYNAGAGAVQQAGNRVPDFAETRNYVRVILGDRTYPGLGQAQPPPPAPPPPPGREPASAVPAYSEAPTRFPSAALSPAGRRILEGYLRRSRESVLRGDEPGTRDFGIERVLGQLRRLPAPPPAPDPGPVIPTAPPAVNVHWRDVAGQGADAARGAAAALRSYTGPLASIPAREVPFAQAGNDTWAHRLASRFALQVTNTFRSPDDAARINPATRYTSRHLARGGAADIAGSPDQMRALANWAIRSGLFAEVFYDPVGQWDSGRYSPRGIGGHADHVHLSYGGPAQQYFYGARR